MNLISLALLWKVKPDPGLLSWVTIYRNKIKTILAATERLQHEFSKRHKIQIAGRVLGISARTRTHNDRCDKANCFGKFARLLQRKTYLKCSFLLWKKTDLPYMASCRALGWV
jgi:hypothetical protein